MKRNLMIAVVFILSAIQLSAQNKPFYHGRTGSTAGNAPLSTGFSNTGANINVLYHKIFWRINPDSTKYIWGSVQTNFKTIQGSVSVITLDLRSVLVVDSVKFRGVKLPAGNITRPGNTVS